MREESEVVLLERVVALDEREDEFREMTNEEYREELRKIFDNIHENYKLRWFYRFTVQTLRDDEK